MNLLMSFLQKSVVQLMTGKKKFLIKYRQMNMTSKIALINYLVGLVEIFKHLVWLYTLKCYINH